MKHSGITVIEPVIKFLTFIMVSEERRKVTYFGRRRSIRIVRRAGWRPINIEIGSSVSGRSRKT